MELKIFYFLCGAILLYDQTIAWAASESSTVKRDPNESSLVKRESTEKINYAQNTPYSDEEKMEEFIRTQLVNVPLPVDMLKEIIYLTYNPDKMKIRVSGEVPYDVFRTYLRGLFDENNVWVISPSNSEIPMAEYKRSLEIILAKSDQTKLNSVLGGAAKIRVNSLGENETKGRDLQQKATVIVPHLFRGNFTLISPVLDFYFPELANVSLVKSGDAIVRYNDFRKLHDGISEPVALDKMNNIPMDGGEISFTNLRHMLACLNHDETLVLSRLRENSILAEKGFPLAYWITVSDAMNVNADEYLNMTANGKVSHENLPWVGCKAMNNSVDTFDMIHVLGEIPQMDMNLGNSATENPIYVLGEIPQMDTNLGNSVTESPTNSNELSLVKRDSAKKINYAENTPFSDEERMKEFIRTQLVNVPLPVDTLKEILYLTYNSHKMKIRVSGEVPYDVFRTHLRGLFDENKVWVISPSNSEIPMAEYIRSLEIILAKSGEIKPDSVLGGAAKIHIHSLGENETKGHDLQQKATVIVPHLFRGNFTLISPVLDFYFPELANVSLVKSGDAVVRYNDFRKLHDSISEPVSLEKMNNIPMDGGEISFTNLRHMLASLDHDETLFLSKLRKNSVLAEKALPLVYWITVLDAMNTNVDEYLSMSANGNISHENLPWVGCCKAMNNSLHNGTSVKLTKSWIPWTGSNASISLLGTEEQENSKICVVYYKMHNMTKNMTFYPPEPCPAGKPMKRSNRKDWLLESSRSTPKRIRSVDKMRIYVDEMIAESKRDHATKGNTNIKNIKNSDALVKSPYHGKPASTKRQFNARKVKRESNSYYSTFDYTTSRSSFITYPQASNSYHSTYDDTTSRSPFTTYPVSQKSDSDYSTYDDTTSRSPFNTLPVSQKSDSDYLTDAGTTSRSKSSRDHSTYYDTTSRSPFTETYPVNQESSSDYLTDRGTTSRSKGSRDYSTYYDTTSRSPFTETYPVSQESSSDYSIYDDTTSRSPFATYPASQKSNSDYSSYSDSYSQSTTYPPN